MTDKEFKRLNRAQMIDIIYQLQLQIEKLTEENKELERELADKRLRLSNAGNIADAALEINNCFRSAQIAAEQYLDEIKAIREEAEVERQQIVAQAQEEVATIISGARKIVCDYDSAMGSILKEYRQSHSGNG